jgi:hypothetical protein
MQESRDIREREGNMITTNSLLNNMQESRDIRAVAIPPPSHLVTKAVAVGVAQVGLVGAERGRRERERERGRERERERGRGRGRGNECEADAGAREEKEGRRFREAAGKAGRPKAQMPVRNSRRRYNHHREGGEDCKTAKAVAAESKHAACSESAKRERDAVLAADDGIIITMKISNKTNKQRERDAVLAADDGTGADTRGGGVEAGEVLEQSAMQTWARIDARREQEILRKMREDFETERAKLAVHVQATLASHQPAYTKRDGGNWKEQVTPLFLLL